MTRLWNLIADWAVPDRALRLKLPLSIGVLDDLIRAMMKRDLDYHLHTAPPILRRLRGEQ